MSQSENKSQATTFTAPVVDQLLERITDLEAQCAALRRLCRDVRDSLRCNQVTMSGVAQVHGKIPADVWSKFQAAAEGREVT